MTDELASATVRIDPDLSYFREKLQADLAAQTEGLGEDVNVASDIKVKTEADKTSLEETRAEVDAAVPDEKTTHVKTDVDNSGLRDLEKAANDADTALSTLGSNGSSSLGSLGTAASSAGGGMGALLTAILTIGPALVPIGAELVAGFGALSGIFAAAGAGVLAFGLAAASQLGPLKTEASDLLHTFQQLAAPEVIPVIHEALALLPPIFAQLFPLVSSVSAEFGHLLSAARSAMQDPFWESFFGFIQQQAGPALEALASFTGGFVKGFAGMVEAFQPLIADVEQGLTRVGASVASFGQGLSSSTGFQSFLQYVRTEGPVVASTLDNLWHVVENLVIGLAPLGAIVLEVVNGLSGFLRVLTGINPILTSVALGLTGLFTAFVALSSVVGSLSAPIAGAIGSITLLVGRLGDLRAAFQLGAEAETLTGALTATSGAAEGTAAVLGGLIGSLGSLAVILGGAGLAALGVWVGSQVIAKDNTEALNKAINKLSNDVLDLPTKTLPQTETALRSTREELSKVEEQSNQTGKSITNLGTVGPAGTSGLTAASGAVAALTANMVELRKEVTQGNDDLGYLQNRFDISRESALALAESLNINLKKALTPSEINEFAAALHDMATQTGVSEAALSHMATTAHTSTATIASEVKAATDAATQSWKSYGDVITQFSSGTLPATASNIKEFYALTELQGATFTQNVQKAIQQGFDPRLISQIIQAGPAQASQLLNTLVNSQGQGLQALTKGAIDAMAKENATAIEQARLTQEAVSSHSSTMASQLAGALAISQALTATNAAAQIATLSKTFTGGLGGILFTAAEYGIALPDAVKKEIANAGQQGTAQAGAVTTGQGSQTPKATAAGHATAKAFTDAVGSHAKDAETAGTNMTTGFDAKLLDTTKTSTSGHGHGKAFTDAAGSADAGPAGTKLVKSFTDSLGNTAAAKAAGTALANALEDGLSSANLTGAARSAAQGAVNGIVQVFLGAVGTATAAARSIAQALPNAINSDVGRVRAASESQANAFISTLEATVPRAESTGKNLSNAVENGIKSVNLNAVGRNLMEGFVNGLIQGSSGTTAAGRNAARAAANAAASERGAFVTAGASLTQGLAAGIQSSGALASLEAAAASAAQKALAAAKGPGGLNSGSPSQAAYEQLGIPFLQGFGGGVGDPAELSRLGAAAESSAHKVLNAAGAVVAQPQPAHGIGGSFVAPVGGGTQVTYNPTYNISGAPDPNTVAQWHALLADHDTQFLNALYARGG